ncbi:MAG: hypothetical protein JXQ82_06125 [Methanomicrobiaceae archaeon]|nr:hypothetical protein [Methanomicrobiaceae archaeon]
MEIKAKVNLLTFITAIILVIGIAAGSYFIVLGGLLEVEEHQVIEDSLRAENYIDYKIFSLNKINIDWALWDPTYYFMDDQNPGYIEENLPDVTFINLNVDAILFFDEHGSLFYGRYYDHNEEEFSEIPEDLTDSLMELEFVKKPEVSDRNFGILKADGRIYIVSVNPILRSDLTGPPKGSFVMAKELSDDYFAEISDEINYNLEFSEISDKDSVIEIAPSDKPRILSYINNEDWISVTSFFYDLTGKPVAELKIVEQRNLFRLGSATILFYSIFAILLCAAIIVIMNLFLDSLFIKRIESISAGLRRIAEEGDYSARINDDIGDEISSISNSANILLLKIEDSIKCLEINNRELKRTLDRKSNLVAELHHRVKNNLQYIISLLGIKSMRITDEKALEVINEATNRIKYLGMIHDDLYNKENKESLLFKEHLIDLTDLILNGIKSSKREKISVQIKGDDFEISLSYAIPLSTALYELIKNSVEHAFDEKGGVIDIELIRTDSDLTIILMDNGKGLKKSDSGTFGFGINNAKNIVTKQLSGTIESMKRDTGTCWIIRISGNLQEKSEYKTRW